MAAAVTKQEVALIIGRDSGRAKGVLGEIGVGGGGGHDDGVRMGEACGVGEEEEGGEEAEEEGDFVAGGGHGSFDELRLRVGFLVKEGHSYPQVNDKKGIQ